MSEQDKQEPEVEGQAYTRGQQEEPAATPEDKAEQKREDEQGPEIEGQAYKRV